jgi:ribonucleoside-diphosphate reductase alpha chain
MTPADSNYSTFSRTITEQKYSHIKPDGTKETWTEIAHRVGPTVLKAVNAKKTLVTSTTALINEKIFIPGGRYLYATGMPYHQTQNCLLLRAQDSREGWAELCHKAAMSLMTGAGIGTNYSDVRCKGKIIRRTGGIATGPIALMQILNEAGRGIMQGGSRRSALWAGLSWKHEDIHDFIELKNWSQEIRNLKEKDFSFPAKMDMTNISVQVDDLFFKAFGKDDHAHNSQAHQVFWATMKRMLKTGEPGFSIDIGANANENLRNACCEICSDTDSDICNLGSINMAKIESLEQMKEVVELGTAFLLAGTVYSDVPYAKVDQVRSKNRRLGLGLMGLHEWLLKKGLTYGVCEELVPYLEVYANSTNIAEQYANTWDLSCPIKTRAIAPTGTIGIVAETTTGIEPIFCAAYKRRYLKHDSWNFQYVLDPTAQRLVQQGIDPDKIEDAYSLSEDIERRLSFQAFIQQYVDHAISSTINLPAWGSELNNEDKIQEYGKIFFKYLPKLRGITVYPDGARGGQPLVPVKYSTACKKVGQIFEEKPLDVCDITKGGSCGE